MATSLTLQNDASLAQGYIQVNGTTSATFTTSGITGNLTGNVTGSLTAGGSLTLATAQTASGTAVDFTGIPSWAKRITVMFSGVSTNGTSPPQMQIGSGSVTTSGYLGTNIIIGASSVSALFTTGFGIGVNSTQWSAAAIISGTVTLFLVNGNTWACSGVNAASNVANMFFTAGSLALAGTLDRIRITTVNGTDTFDAGTINISFEG